MAETAFGAKIDLTCVSSVPLELAGLFAEPAAENKFKGFCWRGRLKGLASMEKRVPACALLFN